MKRLMTMGVAVVVAMAAGCATMGAMSDAEKVASTVNKWKEATEALDLTAIMALVSDDFIGDGGANKEAFRAYLANFIDSGMFDGVEISTERAETTIEGDQAEVRGLELSSFAGSVVVDLILKRDADGVWRISGLRA